MLAAIVGGGKASRLFTTLRDARGAGYIVGADAHLWRDGGMFVAYVEHGSERATIGDRSLTAWVRDVLEGLISRPPTDAEMARARGYVEGTARLSTERALDLAHAMAVSALLTEAAGGSAGASPSQGASPSPRVRSVTAADVVRVAAEALRNRVEVTVVGASTTGSAGASPSQGAPRSAIVSP
jgi:predicted Zn-dependent peptidase